jgi:hypothetical protein
MITGEPDALRTISGGGSGVVAERRDVQVDFVTGPEVGILTCPSVFSFCGAGVLDHRGQRGVPVEKPLTLLKGLSSRRRR